MSHSMTVKDIIHTFEQWSPKHLAYDWDNVGLQVGSMNKPVNKVMVALDVLENVVDEAVEKQVDLIIAHHPLLFVKLKQINLDSPKGRIVKKLIQHDITVYAAHTNLDVAKGGVNDVMAEKIGLKQTKPLIPHTKDELIKLVVFVPDDHVEQLRGAISEAGAGHIGNYSHCTYQVSGEGTFMPEKGTSPFIGEHDKLEKVEEKRIETIVPKSRLAKVLQAMKDAHPYEEVAYDLYPLANEGETLGVGRVGLLEQPMKLGELNEFVKLQYDVPAVRFTGDPDKKIKKVALLGGSGEDYIHQAKRSGADVYITGDMTFHMAQDAEAMGLALIDPGHYVEKVICPTIAEYLEVNCNPNHDLTILLSVSHTEPFTFG